MTLSTFALDGLEIRDEKPFRKNAIYAALKGMLLRDGAIFRVLPPVQEGPASWDRALFLNLTYWNADEPSDVLVEAAIDADVVAHVGWHHAARKALHPGGSTDALLLGEAIASAFDLYLVGILLASRIEAEFLESQVPAMAEAAEVGGLSPEGFERLLASVCADPGLAFEDLRALLFDVTTALVDCVDVDGASAVFEAHESNRMSPLLHHFALSAWVVSAQRMGRAAAAHDPKVRGADRELRSAFRSIDWLVERWLP